MAVGEPLEVQSIGDDEWITQRIARGRADPPDIDRPRPKDMGKVSGIRGRVSPSEAYHVVRKGSCGPDDGARYASVEELRGAGFVVAHSPNRSNPGHVSVSYPGVWDDDVALLFTMCFAERVWNAEETPDE